MNIEIANRLVNLRKEMGLSQEQLAEKIGVSRQAVSKWERSEASPDTDNIILLARLYNISLDELLRTEDDIPQTEGAAEEKANDVSEEPEASGFEQAEAETAEETAENFSESSDGYYKESPNGDKVHIGLDGIHVEDSDGDVVHIGLGGIHVDENGGDHVHIGPGGIFVNDKQYTKEELKNWHKNYNKFDIPIIFISLIGFLAWGFMMPFGWEQSWLFLLLIPILCSLESAIRRKNPSVFAYPVLIFFIFCFTSILTNQTAWALFVTIPYYYIVCNLIKGKSIINYIYPTIIVTVYLIAGFYYNLWHPAWIIFLTIPIYYWVVNLVKKK